MYEIFKSKLWFFFLYPCDEQDISHRVFPLLFLAVAGWDPAALWPWTGVKRHRAWMDERQLTSGSSLTPLMPIDAVMDVTYLFILFDCSSVFVFFCWSGSFFFFYSIFVCRFKSNCPEHLIGWWASWHYFVLYPYTLFFSFLCVTSFYSILFDQGLKVLYKLIKLKLEKPLWKSGDMFQDGRFEYYSALRQSPPDKWEPPQT